MSQYSCSFLYAIYYVYINSGSSLPSKKSVKELQEELQTSLRVVVREDGSVDWDGALETGKEVAKFGKELWERINGKEVKYICLLCIYNMLHYMYVKYFVLFLE